MHHITQMEAPAEEQAKASSWTPALSPKAWLGMMPFLMVEAVLAPTARAPVISKMVHKIMACLYVTDRDETLVAQALATSSTSSKKRWLVQIQRAAHSVEEQC